MRIRYNKARDTIIEHTAIGYTIASMDRLWTVFIFDLWSEGDRASLRFNRLYSSDVGGAWLYDPDIREGAWFFTTRKEAEDYAEELREHIEKIRDPVADYPVPKVYVINWGDDARYDAQIIGRDGATVRLTPKFKGSEAAWEARREMSAKWIEANQ